MNTFSHVPPGFRFHPTDEELVDYYLRKKVASRKIDLDVIKDVDLYKIEPWDLQEKCKIGAEEQNDQWYFFSHKDKKYPTGTRTNRATTAGFWKATGRDKPIYSRHSLIGMRKTLVFYQGRAPNGQKSDWIMHEYRLETNENATTQEEGWVVCRVFKKRPVAPVRRTSEHDHSCWYGDHVSFIPDLDSPRRMSTSQNADHIPYQQQQQQHLYSFKQELDLQYRFPNEPFLQLPQLESPRLLSYVAQAGISLNPSTSSLAQEEQVQSGQQQIVSLYTSSGGGNSTEEAADPVTDWRVLDKFVASQLSQEDVPEEPNYSNSDSVFPVISGIKEVEPVTCYASTSISNCPIDLWK